MQLQWLQMGFKLGMVGKKQGLSAILRKTYFICLFYFFLTSSSLIERVDNGTVFLAFIVEEVNVF